MREASPHPSRFRLGEFEFDPRAGELWRAGRRVRLQEQQSRVLQLLLKNPGQLVTREELGREVWGSETYVDFDHGLNKAVSKLREALGDCHEQPRYIETLPRRGYRLIVPVEVHAVKASPSYRWLAVAAAVLVLLLVGSYRFLPAPQGAGQTSANRTMLVILPFDNLSGNPEQEYFSDGLTEELITQVGRLEPERLGVIARTSAMQYKRTGKGAGQVGRELGVDYLLEGSVRREGDQVRISAQLIRTSDETHVWADSYQRDMRDILGLQRDVAASVAGAIEATLKTAKADKSADERSVNPQAYEAYLKGRYYWNKRTSEDVKRGLEYFELALRADPLFAAAYVGVADSCIVGSGTYLGLSQREAYARARTAVMKALEINPRLAEAHATLAGILFEEDWDWAGAEREFQESLALDAGNSMTHIWYAEFLSAMGRHEEAMAEAKRARDLDPLSLVVNWSLGARLYFARRYDESVLQLRKTLELDPNFVNGYDWLWRVYDQMEMHDQAAEAFQTELRLADPSQSSFLAARDAYGDSGPAGLRYWRLRWLERQSRRQPVSLVVFAQKNALLGHRDVALDWLEKAYRQHDAGLVWLRSDPMLDCLRDDARFQALLRRMNFSG